MNKTASKLPPGFKKQVFGATLAVFGTVDTVMNQIVGIAPDGFFLVLIPVGILLFAIGIKQK